MRTFIVGDETKLKPLGEKLLLANLSQVRSEARPSKPARSRQAASSVSCKASSASWNEPSIR